MRYESRKTIAIALAAPFLTMALVMGLLFWGRRALAPGVGYRFAEAHGLEMLLASVLLGLLLAVARRYRRNVPFWALPLIQLLLLALLLVLTLLVFTWSDLLDVSPGVFVSGTAGFSAVYLFVKLRAPLRRRERIVSALGLQPAPNGERGSWVGACDGAAIALRKAHRGHEIVLEGRWIPPSPIAISWQEFGRDVLAWRFTDWARRDPDPVQLELAKRVDEPLQREWNRERSLVTLDGSSLVIQQLPRDPDFVRRLARAFRRTGAA